MRRLCIVAVVAALALALAPAAAPGKAQAGPSSAAADVVALGDSFASGEGAADFGELEGVTPCHRAPTNMSAVAVAAVDSGWSRVDATCSGAETPALSTAQVLDDGTTNAPQLQSLVALDPAGARMVTLSIGGNDAGFGDVLLECVLVGLGAIELLEGRFGDLVAREGATCEDRNTFLGYCSAEEAERGGPPQCPENQQTVNRGPRTEEFLLGAFAGTLASAYDQVIAELVEVTAAWGSVDTSRAVQVYITDYPLIFPIAPVEACATIEPSDLLWLNRMWVIANEVIAREVAAADARAQGASSPVSIRMQHVPLGDVLDGHRLCEAEPADPPTEGDATSAWVNGISIGSLMSDVSRPYAFHPNAAGHAAMGERLAEALRNPLPPHGTSEAGPMPGAEGGTSAGSVIAVVVMAAGAVAAVVLVTAMVRRGRRGQRG